MKNMKELFVFATFGLIGWALCGMVMGIGLSITSENNTIAAHAILAPVFFFTISLIYHKKFHYTKTLETAAYFTLIVIFLDAYLVAPVFNGSYDMFTSFAGTWLPFGLIFVSSYLGGMVKKKI